MNKNSASEATPLEGPLLVSIATAGRLLGLSPYMTRRLVEEDVLPSELIGGQRFIPASSVHDYVASIAARIESAS